MMELNFDGAEISKGLEKKYLEPGNHIVVVTEVQLGESLNKKTPFVEIKVQNEAELTCSQQYYLTEKAWNISKSAILTIVAAANNVNEAKAKTMLEGLTDQNIAEKLAASIVGKKFAITLNGEWINPQDLEKPSWTKAVFGSYLFAVPADRISMLSKKPYIKGEKDNRPANGGSGSSIQAAPQYNHVVEDVKDAWDE